MEQHLQALTTLMQDRVLVLALAWLLSGLLIYPLRQMLRLNALAVLLDRFIIRFDTKLNKNQRDTATRLYRGIILLMLLAFVVGLLWFALASAHRTWPGAVYIEIVLLALMMTVGSSFSRATAIARMLKKKQTARAAEQLQKWRPVAVLPADIHSLARRSIEALCEDLSQVLALMFWYLLLGFPAALWAAMIGRLYARIGYESDRYRAFGWAASAMQALLQWPASRMAALVFVVASALVPGGRPWGALRSLRRDRKKVQPLHEGWVLASAAGALRVGLAGPRQVAGGGVKRDAWVGSGSAKTELADLRRALWLYATSSLMVWLGLLGTMAAMG